MIRIKTLSLPLISALAASAVVPASAQVALELSSNKVYRQNKNNINFRGGSFTTSMSDGSVTSIGGCDFIQYYPPGYFIGYCSAGTTGLITSGTINGATRANPYLLVNTLQKAIAIAPREPEYAILRAAPASKLKRPSGGFKDNSASVYFNLHTETVQEYLLTNYTNTKNYSRNQRKKFESEIVPGAYYYSFPRLIDPTLPAPVNAVIYPMTEGLASKNKVQDGFKFTDVNDTNWVKGGFVELSYFNPNTFTWRQLSPNYVYAAVDSLYFSVRVLRDPKNPNSALDLVDNYSGQPQSIFPNYTNTGDPRVLLSSPFNSRFTLPPTLAGGTRGMAELQMQRAFKTGGVSYDFSSRRFQIPVIVVNKYSEYRDGIFPNNKKDDLLADADGDGFNNLNEWILDSSAVDAASIPEEPRTVANDPVYDLDFFDFYGFARLVRDQYFGFTINKKLETRPGVVYTLQRSKDRGLTWENFPSGYYYADGTYSKIALTAIVGDQIVQLPYDWHVSTVRLARGVGALKENAPERVEIRVESGEYSVDEFAYVQPPGTEGDLYRTKITLKKTK